MKYQHPDLPLDMEWPDSINPSKWRRLPDPDPEPDDDDEDRATAQYVIDILGFDPKEFD